MLYSAQILASVSRLFVFGTARPASHAGMDDLWIPYFSQNLLEFSPVIARMTLIRIDSSIMTK